MLPDIYANQYLSLLPNQTSPALSVMFLMDSNANICHDLAKLLSSKKVKLNVNFKSQYQIATTLIRSQYKLSYARAKDYVNGMAIMKT